MEYVSYWNNIIQGLKDKGKIMLYTNLINSKAKQINDLILGIEFPRGLTSFGKTVLEKPENKLELEKMVSIEAGKNMQIRYLEQTEREIREQTIQENPIENLSQELDIPINIIEE